MKDDFEAMCEGLRAGTVPKTVVDLENHVANEYIAQLVEHNPLEIDVSGSTPDIHTKASRSLNARVTPTIETPLESHPNTLRSGFRIAEEENPDLPRPGIASNSLMVLRAFQIVEDFLEVKILPPETLGWNEAQRQQFLVQLKKDANQQLGDKQTNRWR